MTGYAVRRLVGFVAALALISVVVFVVIRVIPGDPAQVMLGVEADPETLEALRDRLGLNAPLHVQFGSWIKGLLTGRLGGSLRYHVPVGALLGSGLAVTAPLAAIAILIAMAIGGPAGIYAARHRNGIGDYGVLALSQLGLAIPAFWAGILLMLLFAVRLRWFPAGGFVPWSDGPLATLHSLLLPGLALGWMHTAVVTRVTRSAMLDVLGSDYVRTARGKGLTERRTVIRHALRNAVIPVITVVGLQFASLLGGTIIIENVFYLPGLGRLLYQSLLSRDFPVIQGAVLLVASLVVSLSLAVDLAYVIVDPRIRFD